MCAWSAPTFIIQRVLICWRPKPGTGSPYRSLNGCHPGTWLRSLGPCGSASRASRRRYQLLQQVAKGRYTLDRNVLDGPHMGSREFHSRTGNVWSNPELTCQHVDRRPHCRPDRTRPWRLGFGPSRLAQQRSGEGHPATQFLEIETFRVTGVSKGVAHAQRFLQNQLFGLEVRSFS